MVTRADPARQVGKCGFGRFNGRFRVSGQPPVLGERRGGVVGIPCRPLAASGRTVPGFATELPGFVFRHGGGGSGQAGCRNVTIRSTVFRYGEPGGSCANACS